MDRRASGCSGEEFLYCVKAAGYAGGGAASGRACGLRPVPPCAAPYGQRLGDDWATAQPKRTHTLNGRPGAGDRLSAVRGIR